MRCEPDFRSDYFEIKDFFYVEFSLLESSKSFKGLSQEMLKILIILTTFKVEVREHLTLSQSVQLHFLEPWSSK